MCQLLCEVLDTLMLKNSWSLGSWGLRGLWRDMRHTECPALQTGQKGDGCLRRERSGN